MHIFVKTCRWGQANLVLRTLASGGDKYIAASSSCFHPSCSASKSPLNLIMPLRRARYARVVYYFPFRHSILKQITFLLYYREHLPGSESVDEEKPMDHRQDLIHPPTSVILKNLINVTWLTCGKYTYLGLKIFKMYEFLLNVCTNMMNNTDSARLAIFILAMDLKKRTVYKANRLLIKIIS